MLFFFFFVKLYTILLSYNTLLLSIKSDLEYNAQWWYIYYKPISIKLFNTKPFQWLSFYYICIMYNIAWFIVSQAIIHKLSIIFYKIVFKDCLHIFLNQLSTGKFYTQKENCFLSIVVRNSTFNQLLLF